MLQSDITYPKLSVIIPSYNQGIFLEETLLSVFNQQYPNLELILIDGGSYDNTLEVLKKYEAKITYWESEKDNGQSHAINKGINRATGEWIAWINSDDIYLPNAFNFIFDQIAHEDYDFIYGNVCIGDSTVNAVPFLNEQKNINTLKDILKFDYSLSHVIPSQSVFIRKSILEKSGILDEALHYCMDFDWYCRIFSVTERRFFYPEVLSFFRIHSASKTGSSNNIRGEAQLVAKRYIHLLSKRDQKEIRAYLAYNRQISKSIPKSLQGVFLLLKLFIQYGAIAWKHPHFKIQLKHQLTFHNKLE